MNLTAASAACAGHLKRTAVSVLTRRARRGYLLPFVITEFCKTCACLFLHLHNARSRIHNELFFFAVPYLPLHRFPPSPLVSSLQAFSFSRTSSFLSVGVGKSTSVNACGLISQLLGIFFSSDKWHGTQLQPLLLLLLSSFRPLLSLPSAFGKIDSRVTRGSLFDAHQLRSIPKTSTWQRKTSLSYAENKHTNTLVASKLQILSTWRVPECLLEYYSLDLTACSWVITSSCCRKWRAIFNKSKDSIISKPAN